MSTSIRIFLLLISGIMVLCYTGWGQPIIRSVPSTYSTIQAAITASSNGDIIEVDAGTYTIPAGTQLIINKSVTLRAKAGLANKPRISTNLLNWSQCNVQIAADNVVIDGFEIDNALYSPARSGYVVGDWGGAKNNWTIRNCNIHDGRNGVRPVGNFVTIENNEIHETSSDCINCEYGRCDGLKVTKNWLHSEHTDSGAKPAGITYNCDATSVSDVEISYNYCHSCRTFIDFQHNGGLAPGNNIRIFHNTVDWNMTAVPSPVTGTEIAQQMSIAFWTGGNSWNASKFTIRDNIFSRQKWYEIVNTSDATGPIVGNMTLANNLFYGWYLNNGWYPSSASPKEWPAAQGAVGWNTTDGDFIFTNNVQGNPLYSATGTTPATYYALAAGSPAHHAASDGTDIGAWQALPIHNTTQNTYFSAIQDAITAAHAGDTITVADGTYTLTSNITLDKSLTLLGPNAGLSPRNGGSSRGAEAIINGGAPGALNGSSGYQLILATGITSLTVNGFKFTNFDGNLFASSLVPVTSVDLHQNIFTGNNGGLFYKFDTSVPTVFNVTDNRIANQSMTVSNTALFFLGNVSNSHFDDNEITTVSSRELINVYDHLMNTTIDRNVMTNTAGLVSLFADQSGVEIDHNSLTNITIAGGAAIYVGTNTGHVVSNLRITNNTLTTINGASGIIVACDMAAASSITNVLVEGNTITTSLYGLTFDTIQNGTGTISGVTVRNNTFVNNTFSPILVYSRINPTSGINFVGNVAIDSNTFTINAALYTSSFYLIDYRNVGGTNSFIGNNFTMSGILPGGTDALRAVAIRGSRTGTFNIVNNNFNGGGVTHNNAPTVFVSGIVLLSKDATTGNIPATSVINVTGNTITGWEDAVAVRDGVTPSYGGLVPGVDVNLHNNSISANSGYGVRSGAGETIDAISNWWGNASGPYHATFNPTGTGNTVSDNVTFNPWTGKTMPLTVLPDSVNHLYVVTNTVVELKFTSIPPGTNATVTVQEIPSLWAGPPALPSNTGTVAPLYLQLGAVGLTNGTFTCVVTIDVSGMTGFSSSTVVMYYSTISNSWVGVTGTYDGVAHTFTFTTDHFTPFVFVNPGNPINLYLTTDNTNTSKNIFYPHVGMGTGLTYGVDDWTYATPKCTLYVVPTGTQGIVAANFRILYDATKASVVATAGNLFTGTAFYTSSPGAGQLLIQTSNLDASINTVPGSNKYLAMLEFTITKPGYNSIGLDDLDFRYYNAGSDAQNSVAVTTYPGSIKFYLGDIAKAAPSPSMLTGDGQVEFSDLSPFSSSYWSTNNVLDPLYSYYRAKYDIGPTSNSGYFSMPTPDGKVEFEDLVIFSIGYGKSAAGQLPKQSVQPITLATLASMPQSDGTTRVPIKLSGAVTDVRALSLSMSYPPAMTFVGVEKAGEFDNDYSFMKSKAESGKLTVDAAILGLEHKGVSNAGVIAYAVFNGTGNVCIEQVRARNSANNPIGVTIENSGTVPTFYSLSQNYPNPFNPTTSINYQLPKNAQVTIVIYNTLGEEVATLVNGMQSAGSYTATWNGKDGRGQTVSSGMYLYKMTAGDYTSIKKMILMK